MSKLRASCARIGEKHSYPQSTRVTKCVEEVDEKVEETLKVKCLMNHSSTYFSPSCEKCPIKKLKMVSSMQSFRMQAVCHGNEVTTSRADVTGHKDSIDRMQNRNE